MDLSRKNLQSAERASGSKKGTGKLTAQDSFFGRESQLSHSFFVLGFPLRLKLF